MYDEHNHASVKDKIFKLEINEKIMTKAEKENKPSLDIICLVTSEYIKTVLPVFP